MAREHARIWLDINDDEEFQARSFDAQAFYTRIVLTDATLNYCGVMDWRPRRLTTRAPDLTVDRITACAAELEVHRYLLFDLDTEECLARSYIRRDELIRNPKMAATVIKAYPAVASRTLRAAIVTELRRVRDEHPEYSSWSHKDTAEGLARLLSKTPLAEVGYTPQITYVDAVQNGDPDPVPNAYRVPVKNGYPDAVQNTDPGTGPEHQSFSVPNPSTSTLHPSPAPLEGLRNRGTSPDDPPAESDEPPRRCPKHEDVDDPPLCGACAEARRANDRWHTERAKVETERANAQAAANRLQAAEDRLRAIENCTLGCDEDGYRDGQICHHNPAQDETNHRGSELVRAVLAREQVDLPPDDDIEDDR